VRKFFDPNIRVLCRDQREEIAPWCDRESISAQTDEVISTPGALWLNRAMKSLRFTIIRVSALSVVAMMLISCASELQTTTTTTRQTTDASSRLPTQPMGL
jgi:hypothetical protein